MEVGGEVELAYELIFGVWLVEGGVSFGLLGLGVEDDGGPNGAGGLGGRGGGELGGFDLEDTELRGGLGGVVVAEGAFGEARTGAAGGDELAGELDEIGGDVEGWCGGCVEYGRLAEGDLLIEGEAFVVEGIDGGVGIGGGEGLGYGGRRGVKRVDGLEGADGEWDGCGWRIGDEEGGQREGGLLGRGDVLGGWQVVEFGEEVVLGVGDGLCGEDGDVDGCFGLTDGVFGFGGEDGAIAGGVSVALGDGGGDACSTGLGGGGDGDGRGGAGGGGAAAGAVGGEALGDLLLEGERGGGAGRVAGVVARGYGEFDVKLCGAHYAETLNLLW